MISDKLLVISDGMRGCGWRLMVACCLMTLAGGCSLDYGLQECPYNVRFTFVPVDGRGVATGDYPIDSLRMFVYDAEHVLMGEYPGDTCHTGIATLNLPPGEYTLVAWGNADDETSLLEHITPTESRLEEGTLKPHVYSGVPSMREGSGSFAMECRCTGRLYYGTAAFTAYDYGVAEYSIGMMHAHARLNLTVEWTDEVPAGVRSAREPLMWLKGVGTGYRFTGGETWGDYCFPCHAPEGTGAYRTAATLTTGYKIKGSFTTLRLRDEDHPVVTVTDGSAGLMRDIDLSRYFTVMGIGLSRNIRQEFDLTIRISRDQTLIMQTNLSGWEEGGMIGTN